MSKSLRFGPTAKAVVAAFALALVLLLELCASDPSLHSRLHTDGNHSSGFCVVCALASGQLGWAGTIPVAAIACVVILYVVALKEISLVSAPDLFSLPTRGPPLA
ncbi:MAG TPA: hypothetical protein VGO67_07765 [Verrucomicrobiae bacterium]|jgi:hypothetical protein